jgi:hypothetical protein
MKGQTAEHPEQVPLISWRMTRVTRATEICDFSLNFIRIRAPFATYAMNYPAHRIPIAKSGT